MTSATPILRSESGSAYIVALLVLVVLTILGLSLALITQTELQIGGNERAATRVFYAADTGIEFSVAKALVTSDHSGVQFAYTEKGTKLADTGLIIGNQVEVTPLYPILDSPCNLCEINNAGTYSERAFLKINHAVTANAQLFGTVDAGANRTPIAQKALTTMIEIQPWKSAPQALAPIDDPEVLQKIKF